MQQQIKFSTNNDFNNDFNLDTQPGKIAVASSARSRGLPSIYDEFRLEMIVSTVLKRKNARGRKCLSRAGRTPLKLLIKCPITFDRTVLNKHAI